MNAFFIFSCIGILVGAYLFGRSLAFGSLVRAKYTTLNGTEAITGGYIKRDVDFSKVEESINEVKKNFTSGVSGFLFLLSFFAYAASLVYLIKYSTWIITGIVFVTGCVVFMLGNLKCEKNFLTYYDKYYESLGRAEARMKVMCNELGQEKVIEIYNNMNDTERKEFSKRLRSVEPGSHL